MRSRSTKAFKLCEREGLITLSEMASIEEGLHQQKTLLALDLSTVNCDKTIVLYPKLLWDETKRTCRDKICQNAVYESHEKGLQDMEHLYKNWNKKKKSFLDFSWNIEQ